MNAVIFTIADKEYGMDIRQVERVTRRLEVVPVPDAASFVEGVVNLRGNVIPLVSLRQIFGLERQEAQSANRIIITVIHGHIIGILVDRVADVLRVDEGAITAPDEVLKAAQYLKGVAKVNNRLVLMVDADKLLTSDDKASIQKVHERIEIRKKDG